MFFTEPTPLPDNPPLWRITEIPNNPRIKRIEFYPDGAIKRIEYKDGA